MEVVLSQLSTVIARCDSTDAARWADLAGCEDSYSHGIGNRFGTQRIDDQFQCCPTAIF
jgi:hypothetical protein